MAVIVSPEGITDESGRRKLLAEQARSFHFGMLERECRGFHVLVADADLALKLAELHTDVVVIDAGKDESAVLLALGNHSGEMPYPAICFNEHAPYDSLLYALESGVSAFVAAAFSVERLRMALDVALARFQILRKQRRELLEMKRKVAALTAQGLLEKYQLKC